jgi:beta-glucosidase
MRTPLGALIALLTLHIVGPAARAATVPDTDATIHPLAWPAISPPLASDPALEARARALLASMTLEEKVGQILQADIASVTPEDVRRYHLGSVLNGGNSKPGGDPYAAPAKWLALADAFYAASAQAHDGRPGIPILWGADAVHGHSLVVGATVFPHNIGLGAARNPELVRQIAAATAREVRATGLDWAFAPVLAVPQDIRWGRSYEGFSEDPRLVASYAGAVVIGMQGQIGTPDFLDADHVVATAKHFVGDGGTNEGRDQGDAPIPEAVLRDVHAAGYPPAIAAGVQSIMVSYSSWNSVKNHGNRALLTDVVKGRWQFGGFIVSDWNGHGPLPGCSAENCPLALNAGLDMYMAPDSWRGLYTNLLAQVHSGVISPARLDDAVLRILRVKLRAHLMEEGPPSQRKLAGHFELLGAPAHRAIAREAVRESLVLLKNAGHLLPLDPRRHILVAGDGADDIGKQAGGWTLSWQGSSRDNSHFAGATSIWSGIRAAVTAAGGSAELAPNGRFHHKPDAAIVVFGENPYAEFRGDLATLRLHDDDAALKLLLRLHTAHIPVVAVLLSGRPLWLNREINASDAFVAAWLPGSEGAGVADILLRDRSGSIAHDLRGKLSFSWPGTPIPASAATSPAARKPLFALGYGLRYADPGELRPLPERLSAADAGADPGVLFLRGHASAPWEFGYTDAQRAVRPITTLATSVTAGRLRMRYVDHVVQEGAVSLAWSGGAAAGIALYRAQPIDFNRETNGDVLLTINLRIDTAPTAAVVLGVECGPQCAGFTRVDAGLRALPSGVWRHVGVPLKCFAVAGADMGRLTAGLVLRTTGALALSVSDVTLGVDADAKLPCTATNAPP